MQIRKEKNHHISDAMLEKEEKTNEGTTPGAKKLLSSNFVQK
jgi:hypothetical protein